MIRLLSHYVSILNPEVVLLFKVVEIYSSAPGAGTYLYETVTFPKEMVLVNVNLGNDDPSLYAQIWVYRGERTAYLAANNKHCVFLQRKIQAAGASYPAYDSYVQHNTRIYVSPGVYTCAIRCSVAMTHFRGIFVFESL